jgi:hypothetical protein
MSSSFFRFSLLDTWLLGQALSGRLVEIHYLAFGCALRDIVPDSLKYLLLIVMGHQSVRAVAYRVLVSRSVSRMIEPSGGSQQFG